MKPVFKENNQGRPTVFPASLDGKIPVDSQFDLSIKQLIILTLAKLLTHTKAAVQVRTALA
jgi:hypothetical protein